MAGLRAIEIDPTGEDRFRELLSAHNLPIDDLAEPGRHFWCFAGDDRIVGYGGIEQYGGDALLRSVVVEPSGQRGGTGTLIVAIIERLARDRGVRSLHLLTEGAADFFEKTGYSRRERHTAPPAIAESRQFAALCPASAAYLVKSLA